MPNLDFLGSDNIGDCRIFQNVGGRIPHIEKHPVESPVALISRNQNPQLIRIPEWRERPVNQANDFTEPNLGRPTVEPIAPLCPTYAFDNASALQC
jgi:hypothetical protein